LARIADDDENKAENFVLDFNRANFDFKKKKKCCFI
jgi:hypothetical protein